MKLKKPSLFTIWSGSTAIAFLYSYWRYSRDSVGWRAIVVLILGAMAAFVIWAVENP